MGTDSSLQIERAAYEEFIRLWSQGSFEHQRLGQALYNHFSIYTNSPIRRLHRSFLVALIDPVSGFV